MKLYREDAARAIQEKIAKPLGLTETDAAAGIFRIATAHMSDLIRKATVERGYDPREFVMFAYGGAAPIHASRYAAQLGVKKVIVPVTASVHGATGLISSDVVYEYGKSDHLVVPADVARVNQNFSAMVEQAMSDLRAAGFTDGAIKITRSVDIRYRYQVHELNVPFDSGTAPITAAEMERLYDHFDELYEQSYGKGSAYREAGKEIITCRVTGIGALTKPELERQPQSDANPQPALKDQRQVYFEENGEFAPTPVYDFDRLSAGAEIPGAAIIETPVTTIVVNPNDRAVVDGLRNVVVYVGAQE